MATSVFSLTAVSNSLFLSVACASAILILPWSPCAWATASNLSASITARFFATTSSFNKLSPVFCKSIRAFKIANSCFEKLSVLLPPLPPLISVRPVDKSLLDCDGFKPKSLPIRPPPLSLNRCISFGILLIWNPGDNWPIISFKGNFERSTWREF